ncbi:reverse transcriptase domain-containing protein [Tanacetum coccineum]
MEIPVSSDEELEEPMKDQLLPADASPTALSPGYISDSDPEEDEEDPEEDPADYPAAGGDNDNNESSDDDNDDDDMILSPQAENTEAFETEESASTPPTSPHHIILSFETKSRTETMTTVDQGMSVEEIERVIIASSRGLLTTRKSRKVTEMGSVLSKGNCKKVDHIDPGVKGNESYVVGINDTHTCYNQGGGVENKRKLNNTSKNNQNQQQPNKRQNTGKDYAAGHGEKKYYGGSKPLRPTNDNTTNNQRGTGTSQKVNCYECGNQGHYRRDCPERKNQSHKNQIGRSRHMECAT